VNPQNLEAIPRAPQAERPPVSGEPGYQETEPIGAPLEPRAQPVQQEAVPVLSELLVQEEARVPAPDATVQHAEASAEPLTPAQATSIARAGSVPEEAVEQLAEVLTVH
jgi:hypothetical protein